MNAPGGWAVRVELRAGRTVAGGADPPFALHMTIPDCCADRDAGWRWAARVRWASFNIFLFLDPGITPRAAAPWRGPGGHGRRKNPLGGPVFSRGKGEPGGVLVAALSSR